ncbi:NADH dehydrogenase [ubiquinone] 1 subunit C2 [Pseudophryne corroboree]|uniref:NADH dehydrogenase [ubiquinone] 1 subunit C2 n=1 Tax=Pseudophryne corroboree TaxID=495146 RepID=UPI003081CF33
MGLMPDEARGLPPPNLVNRGTVYVGFLGYLSAIIHNAINRFPVMKAGVHRQLLYTTIGVFLGYHMVKYENYKYAKRDRELFEYMRLHPELFPQQEKRTFAEITEKFYPVR